MSKKSHFSSRLFEYWKELSHSHHRRMSRGAENIFKMISRPHGDNWRRKESKKESHKK